MTEFITSLNEWAVLLGGLFGLLSTACGVFFAVKNWITVLKTKKSQEIWALIMEIADKAMEEAKRYKRYYFHHEYDKWEAEIKAETVRKMQEKIRAKSEYGTINMSPWQLDQIAKEVLED
jgi:hypothetical protein